MVAFSARNERGTLIKKMNIAPAMPAATIVLLRDFEGELQVFMQQRAWAASFVAGAYVFPGGKVDAQDYNFPKELIRYAQEQEQKILLQKPGAHEAVIAALRECFEEAGILLAYEQQQHQSLAFQSHYDVWQHYRNQLNNKQLSWPTLLQQQSLQLAVDQLVFVGHWVTPKTSSQRFDTLFFAAKAPEQQNGRHDDFEAINSVWWTPQQALEAHRRKEIQLISPTIVTLEHACKFSCSDEFIEHHRRGLTVLQRNI